MQVRILSSRQIVVTSKMYLADSSSVKVVKHLNGYEWRLKVALSGWTRDVIHNIRLRSTTIFMEM